ncbi:MAG: hypothetical protein K8T25_06335 [Planctomycetia bacterium]|nr:hypothetical protein [Planctomycetia bacterium]
MSAPTGGWRSGGCKPRHAAVLFAAAFLYPYLCSPAPGEEPAAEFLDALQKARYFDVVPSYLDWAQTSPRVSESFKAGIPYQRAVALSREASTVTEPAQQIRQLQAARAAFKQFLQAGADHPQAPDAQLEIGEIEVSLAALKLAQADGPAADAVAARAAARGMYEAASATIDTAQRTIEQRLSRFPKLIPPEEKALVNDRNALRRLRISARLLACRVTYDISKTYLPDSLERTRQIRQAAVEYGKVFDEYSGNLAGLLARFQQGRCLQEVGNHVEALKCFNDLMTIDEKQLSEKAVKSLYVQSLLRAMDSWIALKKYDDAIRTAEFNTTPDEGRQPDWLAIRFLGVKALRLKAETLTSRKREHDEAIAQAVRLATQVANMPGEHQLAAKRFLAEMGHTIVSQAPATFAEARDRAQQSQQAWQILRDAKMRASAEKQRELEPDIVSERRKAIEACRQALAMVDKGTSVQDVTQLQYVLCHLYLDDQDYLAAAVVGEHVARSSPAFPNAELAAKVALKAWLSEYTAAGEDHRFELERVRAAANFILERWPTSDSAADAAFVLMNFALDDGRLDRAQEQLKRIPANSPRRSEAGLRIGLTLWRDYLLALRKPIAKRPPQEQLTKMRGEIERLLSAGVERVQQSTTIVADPTLVAAVLSLAQLYVDSGRPELALKWLEDPRVGTMTMIGAKSPYTQKDAFRVEAYTAALRSYIGVLPTYKNDAKGRDALLKKSMATLDALEQAVGQDAQTAQRLTQVYIVLGKDLEGQLAAARNDAAARQALSTAFEQFLSRIIERPGNAYGALIWAGETFFKLGTAADTNPEAASPAAKAYFGKAATTYEQILAAATRKADFLPSDNARLGVQLRLAKCYRRLGQFDKSLDQLIAVLKVRPSDVTIQMEAAETLQERGQVEDARYFEEAIQGSRPDAQGKNIIWGWSRLAAAMYGKPAYDKFYFEANYRSNQSRYQFAMKLTGPQHARLLQLARKGIEIMVDRYPALGTPDQKAKYDVLLRSIQRELKEPEVGLKAFEHEPQAGG